jgi:hypothetical protein
MRQLSDFLLLLAMVEELVFFGAIWNHPSAGWHTWFVVGCCSRQPGCCTPGPLGALW